MQVSRARASVMLAAWLLVNGCTTMREIPRTDYGQIPAGRNVRVETKDGLVYDFDYATVSGDSLSGVRVRNDIELEHALLVLGGEVAFQPRPAFVRPLLFHAG